MSLPKFLFPKSFSTDFTLHNLPFGVFSQQGRAPRIGVAIGDKIIDCRALVERKLVDETLAGENLNSFMAAGKSVWGATRQVLKNLLSDESHSVWQSGNVLVEQAKVDMLLPAAIGDYTDFYASEHHAANVGKIFRPNQPPLLPNWKHLPVGYHGRASSVIPSGVPVVRPRGQLKQLDGSVVFGSTEKLDFEVELAMYFGGPGNALGTPITVENASEHIFGVTLMNDWSARDIQFWEYVPLGPFLSKNFATTVSPWIVTWEALQPFLIPMPVQTDPVPLPYLSSKRGSLIDVAIKTRFNGTEISNTNGKHLYWSFEQMIAHHTASGCNLRPGDLLGSGTISGTHKGEFGSLLELTWNGKEQIQTLKGLRTFVQNEDEIEMTGTCTKGDVRIGFGKCQAKIIA